MFKSSKISTLAKISVRPKSTSASLEHLHALAQALRQWRSLTLDELEASYRKKTRCGNCFFTRIVRDDFNENRMARRDQSTIQDQARAGAKTALTELDILCQDIAHSRLADKDRHGDVARPAEDI